MSKKEEDDDDEEEAPVADETNAAQEIAKNKPKKPRYPPIYGTIGIKPPENKARGAVVPPDLAVFEDTYYLVQQKDYVQMYQIKFANLSFPEFKLIHTFKKLKHLKRKIHSAISVGNQIDETIFLIDNKNIYQLNVEQEEITKTFKKHNVLSIINRGK